MRRPSSFNTPCGLASVLAEKYPETSDRAERGTAIHLEISTELRGGAPARSPEARAAVAWVRSMFGGRVVLSEEPLELRCPETDALWTAGTCDLVAVGDDAVAIVDFKTGLKAFVEPAEENVQLAAYLAAAMVRWDKPAGAAWLAFLDGDRVDAPPPHVVTDVWALIDRVRKEATRPPIANPGPHCGRCWQRHYCEAYKARATTALALLERPPADLTVTDEVAAALVLRAQAVREACDRAEELAKAHVRAGGRVEADGRVWGPQQVAGRRSVSIKDAEAAGCGHLVKQGPSFEKWSWRRP